MTHQATDMHEPSEDIVDEPWLAAPSRRSRVRVVLVVLLLTLVLFVAGAQVQKRFGGESSASAASQPVSPVAGGQGFEGLPGQSVPGAQGPRTSGSSSSASGDTGESSGSTPVLIGTVTATKARTWAVKDLGGHTHTVRLTSATTITRPADQAAEPVRVGSQVTVEGRKHGLTVTATALTIR